MKQMKPERQYKDRLFRMIFNSKEKLLELYNAMNGTDYENVEDLEVVTLNSAIYLSMKNDVSYIFQDELFLYEHQSSHNPNMPLRCLFYVSDTYSSLVAQDNIYGSRLIKIPAPTFVVFYNGIKQMPEETELLLSDAYTKRQDLPNLELRVKVRNINLGESHEILEKSRSIKDYAIFIDKIRKYTEQLGIEEAIARAIKECIEEDVMADFLRKNRAEVRKMCLYEYDEERQRKFDREEGQLQAFGTLVRDGKLSLSEAAAYAKMSEKEFEEEMKNSLMK